MNASATSPMHREPHPAPQRERVGAFAIWFAIVAAPLAWNLQLLFNAAIAICVLAGIVATRNWRLTREEKPGSAHHLIEAGDGRTRFMAMVGLLCSGLFGLAVLLSAGMISVVPVCSG